MRKTVFAVFGCVEPLLAAGSELLHNFVGRYRVPRRSTAVRVRARCYAHACAPLGQLLRKPASRSSRSNNNATIPHHGYVHFGLITDIEIT